MDASQAAVRVCMRLVLLGELVMDYSRAPFSLDNNEVG
jgi:hypothetical protein